MMTEPTESKEAHHLSGACKRLFIDVIAFWSFAHRVDFV